MRAKRILCLAVALLLFAATASTDWTYNAFTGKFDYYEPVSGSTLGTLSDITFIGLARGAIIYRGVAVWQNLPAGAAGQVLTMGANDPLWAAAGAPGAHAASHEVGGADLVDHDQLTNYLAAQHLTLPNTIAAVLTDHNVAAHNALLITQLGTVTVGVWNATDIGVADGGTGLGAWVTGDIVHATGAAVLAGLADVAVGSVLISGGVGVVPSWSTDIATGVTIGTAYIYRVGGADVNVANGGTGRSTSTTAYGLLAAGTTATNPHQTLAAGLTTQILVGGGAAALPAWGTDIPTAVTIGTAYVYRVGGTDVAVADGGTGLGVWVVGDIVYASGVGTLAGLADVAVNSVLASGGVGVAPAYTTNPTVTTLNAINTIDVNSDGSTGEDGVDFNSINNTYSTIAQSDAEGIAVSSDVRLALDETLRTFNLLDRGDVAIDLGNVAASHPTMNIWDSGATDNIAFWHNDTDGYIETNAGGIRIQNEGGGDITFFESTTGNEYVYIYGFKTADAVKYGRMYVDTEGLFNIDSQAEGRLRNAGNIVARWGTTYWWFARDDYRTIWGANEDAQIEYDEAGDDTWQFSLPAGGMSFRVTYTDADNALLIKVVKVTKAHTTDLFDAAALTDSVIVWQQPANSVLLSAKYVIDTQFAGVTTLDVDMGLVGDNDGLIDAGADLTSGAAGAEYSIRGAYWSATTAAGYHSAAATDWIAYATSTVENLDQTSAGQITFYFAYIQF